MEKVIKYLYYGSLLCFVLPSGDLFGIPIKLMVMLAVLAAFFGWCLLGKKSLVIDGVICGFLFVVAALFVWACIGITNQYDTVFMAFKSFVSLLITVLCTYLLVKNRIVSIRGAAKVLFFVAVIMVAIKLFLEVILILGLLDWEQFKSMFMTITGTMATTMKIPFGGGYVYRIMMTNDFLPLVLCGFYFLYEKTQPLKKVIIAVILGVYTFIVYSRVAMLQYAAVIVFCIASLLWDFIRTVHRKKLAYVLIGAAAGVIVLAAVFAVKSEVILSSLETFATSMYERWLGSSAEYSDSFRVEQKIYLWEGIWKTPLFGQGLGSYIREYLRSEITPFSYEAEYISFIYQFGFIGFALIVGGIILNFAIMCFRGIKRCRLFLLVLLNFGIWILRPLYNPQFLSSSSGMVIVAIFLAGHYYSQQLEQEKERKF